MIDNLISTDNSKTRNILAQLAYILKKIENAAKTGNTSLNIHLFANNFPYNGNSKYSSINPRNCHYAHHNICGTSWNTREGYRQTKFCHLKRAKKNKKQTFLRRK